MNILDEANVAVEGRRRNDYGTPRENHMRTAHLWTEYLHGKYGGAYGLEFVLTPEDVCFLNILQKIARGMNVITRDTLIDIAGYARNVELVQDADRHPGTDDTVPELSSTVSTSRSCCGEDMRDVRKKALY